MDHFSSQEHAICPAVWGHQYVFPTSWVTSGWSFSLSGPYILLSRDGCSLILPSLDILWFQEAEDVQSSWSGQEQKVLSLSQALLGPGDHPGT